MLNDSAGRAGRAARHIVRTAADFAASPASHWEDYSSPANLCQIQYRELSQQRADELEESARVRSALNGRFAPALELEKVRARLVMVDLWVEGVER